MKGVYTTLSVPPVNSETVTSLWCPRTFAGVVFRIESHLGKYYKATEVSIYQYATRNIYFTLYLQGYHLSVTELWNLTSAPKTTFLVQVKFGGVETT